MNTDAFILYYMKCPECEYESEPLSYLEMALIKGTKQCLNNGCNKQMMQPYKVQFEKTSTHAEFNWPAQTCYIPHYAPAILEDDFDTVEWLSTNERD